MDIQIKIVGLTGAMALRQYASATLHQVLDRFSPLIAVVTVSLSDINGPDRGGVDKLCRIAVELKNHTLLVIEELAGEVQRAVDRAASRLPQQLSRASRRLSPAL